jgi:undecaprenyl diphosphate synthase
VHVLGELDRLDAPTRGAVADLVEATRGGESLRLNIMISYSGRGELVRVARVLARRAADGLVDPESIDEADIEEALFTRGLPDPDLLIRTSGEQRISNFLLWQLAYTELHTLPVLWPDFTREHLFGALLDFQGRDRRFGRVTAG